MEPQTRIILDSIADGVFTVDRNWRITAFNRAAETITGIRKPEALGRYCWEVFKTSICEQCCALRHTMETGQPLVNQSIFIINANGDRIPVSISTALLKDDAGQVIGGVETFRDLSVVETLRKELSARQSFQDIISKNKQMQKLFGMTELISNSDTTVLIEGESGTGKALFARAIHSLSRRKDGPLITVTCGAIPDTLLESELFGYKSGAFTDAKRDKPGRIAMAEGGTLFLDEIGDVTPMLQVRLLRVLQDRVYEPLGSVRPETADVRVIAATNKHLDALVDRGVFREDLYYRINVVRLSLPPLRERREDIPLLIDHFIEKFNRIIGKEIGTVSSEVMGLLMAHDFPGNVRELENIMEYATVVCQTDTIGVAHLPDHLRPAAQTASPARGAVGVTGFSDLEREFLHDALQRNQWHRTRTARELGIHPSTLWRKIKRLGLTPPSKQE